MSQTLCPRSILRASLVAALALAPLALGVSRAAAQTNEDAPRFEGRRGERGHRGLRGHRRHRRHEQMRALLQQLDLTDDQRAQLRAVRRSARERLRELRRRGRSPETRAAKHAVHRETRRRIREILTPAQRQRLEELRAHKRAERVTRRVERMTERLALSTAQAAAIRQILERTQAQRRALREADADPETIHARHVALRERTREAIDAVLTPEQRALAAQRRERRDGRRGHRRRGRGPRGERGGKR